ncbi:MAG: radA [Frankiales bacterium]|nr:radA [Frankiales bacterium]
MAKKAAGFACSSCQAELLQWVGRCPRCSEFGTVVELTPTRALPGLKSSGTGSAPDRPARRLVDVAADTTPREPTGLSEFDRAVGGGLVPGQVVLLAGEPGVGKSTLLSTVAHAIATRHPEECVLYVSGEESVEQISLRARRIGAVAPGVMLADESDLATVIGHVEAHQPRLLIVDSVQAMASSAIDGRAGGVTQVQEVASVLTRVAKARHMPVLLIGQSTRENAVAGPRALEHIVDTLLTFEGDKHTSLRLLRTVKNRYGPADEVVCFEQGDDGLREVVDPANLFRSNRETPVPGTCVTITVDGRRALPAEIQALVAKSPTPMPRRGVNGLDSSRVAMLLAVTERAAEVPFAGQDVFVATVGGAKLSDPATDLAVCVAVATAAWDKAMPADLAVIGEVALSGDIRPVPMLSQRIAEAARLGYRQVLVPKGARAEHHSLHVTEVDHLNAALTRLEEISQRRVPRP